MTTDPSRLSHASTATPDELEVWLAAERDPQSASYIVPIAFHRAGGIDLERLRSSLDALQERHVVLRSRFVNRDGALLREVYDAPPIPLVRQESSEIFDQGDAEQWAVSFARLRIDPSDGPLARAAVRQYADRAVVILAFHHLIVDAWAVDSVLTELLALYHEPEGEYQTSLPQTAGDALLDEILPSDTDYWRSLIGADPICLAPPTDFVVSEASVRSAFLSRSVDASLFERLRSRVELAPASTAVVAFSAWAALLHLWSGESEGLSGMTFAGRLGAERHGDVRLRSRVLPVRTALDPSSSIISFVSANRRQVIESLAHSDVSASTVRKLLRRESLAGMDAAFTYLRSTASPKLAAAGWQTFDVPVAAAKTPVGLAITERGTHVDIQLDFDLGRFRPSSAETLLDQYLDLLDWLGRTDTLEGLSFRDAVPPFARHGTGPDARVQAGFEPLVASPVDLVRAHATVHAHDPAIRHNAETVDYASLIADADRVAHALSQRGVGRGDLVGILLPRGIDAVVAVVGVVAAGAAYLPLDPEFPLSQLTAIVADSGLRFVITGEGHQQQEEQLPTEMLPLPVLRYAGLACTGRSDHESASSSSDLFHCIYTSGSTGKPKGVMLDRRGFMRLLKVTGFVPLHPGDTMSHLSPLNFDASTFEIWATLTQGATLGVMDKSDLLDPHAMASAMRQLHITSAIMTSPLFNHLVDAEPQALAGMNWIYFGGEAVSPEHVRRSLLHVGRGVLFHSYGPAENSFTTHYRAVDTVDAGQRTVPLGREVPFTHSYVVYEGTLTPTPIGVPGELLVGGPGLAWGYLGEPSLTARKFVPDPFTGIPGARLYRSGDRVRWNPDGEIEFIGRIDGQVKVRGNRVELAGVETAIRAVESVSTACVLSIEHPARGKELVAFVVARGATAIDDARDYVARQLPHFAHPRRYIEVAALPRKANNKVDQNALRRIAEATDQAEQPREPLVLSPASEDLEGLIAGCWKSLLGHSDIVERNFFDAGGDSLLLFKLSEAIREATGVTLPVIDLLRFTTVRTQAAQVRAFQSQHPPTIPTSKPASESAFSVSELTGPPHTEDAVAIIGIGCTLAGADDLWAYWEALRSGSHLFSGSGIRSHTNDGRDVVDRWGSVKAIPRRLGVYGLSPDEAEALDPQHAVFMQNVLAAIADAGYETADIAPRTAIYAGAAKRTSPAHSQSSPASAFVSALANSNAFMATRAAYGLGLGGEAVMLDTACSTSLVAVHAARASLLSRSSDYALAGGVSIQTADMVGYVSEPGLIYSPTGRCLPFDTQADGTVGGDGSGVVLMKRLSDATRDGDPIYAVIRGSAVNNDGRAKVGYTAPNPEAQVRVIRSALTVASTSPKDVTYVEAHGTGTLLGDRVEAAALSEALGPGAACRVGSAKATIGHLNTAAGVAGLIKTALAIQNRILPGTPGVSKPIEELQGGSGRFTLSADSTTWNAPVLVAGISSFGIGGTNVHIILSEA
ncbi:amino acid adenylation domain-containing protein [Gryllotalpicola reticulitermitis]|uniref:Amino acid adenylation domain-containing protein n=1 Tax=Gryllotalpicola reticulitermitis TaxID=1184153 RepID=A0ABV8Q9B3_9MICO